MGKTVFGLKRAIFEKIPHKNFAKSFQLAFAGRMQYTGCMNGIKTFGLTHPPDLVLNQIAKMFIECYQFASYTGIFVIIRKPDALKSHIKTPLQSDDKISMLNHIYAHFEHELIAHYNSIAKLTTYTEPDLMPHSYMVVQELGSNSPNINIIESDNVLLDTALKVTFKHNASPKIFLHYIDNEYLYWNIDLGSGYSEAFNTKYSNSILDAMLVDANG